MPRTSPLILVIPVYKGGRFFEECLESLRGAIDCFQRIVISFNGPEAEGDHAAFVKSRIGESGKVDCLFPFGNLGSVEHTAFIHERLSGQWRGDTPVFLLAHDDLIEGGALRRFVSTAPLDGSSFYLGDWISFEDGASSGEERHSALPEGCLSLGIGAWLSYNWSRPSRHVYTNMSGMIASLETLRQVAAWYRMTGSTTGARYEYCMATARQHQRIQRSPEPLVKVRHHAGQEGRRIDGLSAMSDELRYRIWMLFNLRGGDFLEHGLWGPWGVWPTLRLAWKWIRRKRSA